MLGVSARGFHPSLSHFHPLSVSLTRACSGWECEVDSDSQGPKSSSHLALSQLLERCLRVLRVSISDTGEDAIRLGTRPRALPGVKVITSITAITAPSHVSLTFNMTLLQHPSAL